MGTDIELFYQVLDRQIANTVSQLTTGLGYGPFADIATKVATQKVHQYLEPYVGALTVGKEVDTDTLCSFAKEKAVSEIEAFKAKMNKGG